MQDLALTFSTWLFTDANATVSCVLGTTGSPLPRARLLLDEILLRESKEVDEDVEGWDAGSAVWNGGSVTWADIPIKREMQGGKLTCEVENSLVKLVKMKTIDVAYEPAEASLF